MQQKLLGYVIFMVNDGVVYDPYFTLWETEESAIQEATKLIDEVWKEDRYANPEHRFYNSVFAEDTQEQYRERREKVKLLQSVEMGMGSDLRIIPVFQNQKEEEIQ